MEIQNNLLSKKRSCLFPSVEKKAVEGSCIVARLGAGSSDGFQSQDGATTACKEKVTGASHP